MNRPLLRQVRKPPLQDTLEEVEQVLERRHLAQPDIIELVHRFRIVRGRREQVRLDNILDKAEIAAGFTRAMDSNRLTAQHCRQPLGYHCCVSACGILTRPEYIEITQPNRRQTEGACENTGVNLIHDFRGRIWRKRFPELVLYFG